MRPLASGLLLVALAAGCSRERSAERAVATAPPAAGVVVSVTPRELSRLAHAGGRPTLVNAWATWCAPCREEFPALLAVARRHPDVRLVLVSADFDEQLPEAKAFLAAHGVTDTTYFKRGGDREFIDAIDPAWSGALPATLVLDARGRRVAFWEGAADSARFEAALARTLHSSP